MSDNSSIYNNILISHENCLNSYIKGDESSTLENKELSSKNLDWRIPLIPKIKKFTNAHYLCPKCHQFPFINFVSKEYIFHKCLCENKKKFIKISQLFIKEKQCMTFLGVDRSDELSSIDKEIYKDFRCQGNHYSKKTKKFEFYCTDCNKNICSECIGKHFYLDDQIEKMHNLIVLIFEYRKNYKDLEFVINKMNDEKNEISTNVSNINEELDESFENSQEKKQNLITNKIINIGENKGMLIQGKNEDKFDYFTEFINIIFTDYLDFPNYNHSYNIENIKRFFKNEKNVEAKIKYINNQNKETKLFGREFVKNNKDKLSIIIDDSIENIKESHQFDQSKKVVEIILTDKNPYSYSNYNNYFNMTYMFQKCDSLYEIEFFNIQGYKLNGDFCYSFDGCTLLQEIPDCVSKWINGSCCDISYMFRDCSSLTKMPDISEWYTFYVSNMEGLFEDCKSLISLPDISKWNTVMVNNMKGLFKGCKSLISLPDISKWRTTDLSNMEGLFNGCKSLLSIPDISNWDTKMVKNMSYMFSDCSNLKAIPDISKWNIKNVYYLSHMFNNCSSLSSIPGLSKWNTNNFEDISGMFKNCSSLEYLDFLSYPETKKIQNKNEIFLGCSKLIKPDKSKFMLDDFNNKYHLNITDTDATNIIILNSGYKILNDLSVIEFKKLKILKLQSNNISNINVLKNVNFDKLEILNLNCNQISDINILENVNFRELKELNLSYNKISNIKVLEKVKFDKLEKLILAFNKISDISILEKVNFKELNELNLSSNKISYIKALEKAKFEKLEILNLSENQISEKDKESIISKMKYKIKELYT